MRRRTFLTLLAAAAAGPATGGASPRRRDASAARVESRHSSNFQQTPHLGVEGLDFRRGSARFEWVGISAFRLAEMIAGGREAEAVAFLDWAASQKLTVVRVFLMARHLFRLAPDRGVAALPRLLELAGARGLHVEAVAFADTLAVPVDFEQHVKAVGAIARKHPNALVEIANEPWHPTQHARLHDGAAVAKLAELVPPGVPVALGSIEGGDGYAAAGDYLTWHAPRADGQDGWRHVLSLADGADLAARWKRPVVSDEPIGAAEASVPGRRDNDPQRFGAAAALTRLAGLGATFHYEDGLQARIPSGRQLACFLAWRAALARLANVPAGGRLARAEALAPVAETMGFRAVFGRIFDKDEWIVGIDPGAGAVIKTTRGWSVAGSWDLAGARVAHVRRK